MTKILRGMNYSPTWIGWSPGQPGQFSDSDFFNDAFEAMWNKGETSGSQVHQYRDDLGVISNAGLNLIRLFNWGPTRGWNGTKGNGHISALNRASTLGMKVIVPVSNYFLSDDKYAWDNTDPDDSFSFSSAPTGIQSDLTNFISSVTVSGSIHSAVHSFSVGNEIDLNNMVGQGTSGPVSPTSRLKRVIWWLINLQAKCADSGLLFTSPISDGDQGGTEAATPSYWFQAIVNGVTNSTSLPNGTVSGGETTFKSTISGLSTAASSYASWYYNSVNIYTTGSKLSSTIGQYDSWTANSKNSLNWPGQQFTVPLMLTEVGSNRGGGIVSASAQETQYTTIVTDIVTEIETYVTGHTDSLLIGYCVYEFSDETTLNANWGTNMVESPTESGGNILFSPMTGATIVSFGTFPSVSYPVQELFPVTSSGGTTLLAGIKAAIS
tara:strand:- start:1209 stop:2519 length:1311 start_codon:yes stop_codon:yes gene_type:complete